MTTDPKCPVCDAELVGETRKRMTWTVTRNGISTGAKSEETKVGWELARRYDCGSVARKAAVDSVWRVDEQCPRAHEKAIGLAAELDEQGGAVRVLRGETEELRKEIADLEACIATEAELLESLNASIPDSITPMADADGVPFAIHVRVKSLVEMVQTMQDLSGQEQPQVETGTSTGADCIVNATGTDAESALPYISGSGPWVATESTE